MEIGETLHVEAREAWRDWLAAHHAEKKEIWLINYKKGARKRSLDYDLVLDEALCFGWIDSQARGVNEEYSVLRWSPRRKGGNWSATNREKVQRLAREGRMTDPGLAAIPADIRAELGLPDPLPS
jgi:uncharacterized protein YdeI (YjbR/CyaY-like superfamily)